MSIHISIWCHFSFCLFYTFLYMDFSFTFFVVYVCGLWILSGLSYLRKSLFCLHFCLLFLLVPVHTTLASPFLMSSQLPGPVLPPLYFPQQFCLHFWVIFYLDKEFQVNSFFLYLKNVAPLPFTLNYFQWTICYHSYLFSLAYLSFYPLVDFNIVMNHITFLWTTDCIHGWWSHKIIMELKNSYHVVI